MDSCPTCCSSCSALASLPSRTLDASYDLTNLLPAGTVQISHLSTTNFPCDHAHAEDGWHSLSDINLRGLGSPAFQKLLESLLFLLEHRFTAATFQLRDSELIIRIYLIPWDLPGVNGELSYHMRKRYNAQALSMAKYHISVLLPQIVQDRKSWTYGHLHTAPETPLIISSSDTRTISEVYSNLPSPQTGLHRNSSSSLVSRLLNFSDTLDGLGLRSTLLKYQRETVAAMLEREEPEQPYIPNPLYVPLKGMDGRIFFYQPGTSEILCQQSIVSIPPGAILCEELGTGKTVMILALILGTMRQLARAEESTIDTRPILTPLAFRHFPSPEYSAVRDRFPRSSTAKLSSKSTKPCVPSLREMLLHQLCINPCSSIPDRTMLMGAAKDDRGQQLAERLEQIPIYNTWLKSNSPFYFHFQDELTDLRTSSRGRKEPGPRIIYLSSATLIIVPPNLISQWDQEIHKHCAKNPRLLIVRSKTVLPLAKDLAVDYDIILMTYPRFCNEDRKADISNAQSWKVCQCPEHPDSRIPDCKCKPPDVSPLLQIRWKRLVVDEGHVSSSLSARLTPFTRLLSVQIRWIVTGTPTTNMLGLSFGGSSYDNDDYSIDFFGAPGEVDETTAFFHDTGSSPGPSLCSERLSLDTFPTPTPPMRVWSSSDNRDISKLLNMASQFIGIKFLADAPTIRTQFKDALFSETGPRPGAIEMLENFMSALMIRHRIADVEEEVVLPKLTRESVLLDLDPLVVLSYNAMQAAILINAIDSERKDQDYMFHPSNAEFLRLTVKNLSQLMFWSVDANLYNAEELAKHTEKILEDAKEHRKSISSQDLLQTEKALCHIRSALRNTLWREIQKHEDIPYQVSQIPDAIFKAWSRLAGVTVDIHLIHPDRLLRLRQQAIQHPLSDEVKLCFVGCEIAEADSLHRQLFEQMEQKKNRREKLRLGSKRSISSGISASSSDFMKTRGAARNSLSVENIKEMQRELQAALARLNALENNSPTTSTSTTFKFQPSILLRHSPVAHVRIGKTASSKLDYIIEEVQKYSPTEKFLIFSESPLTLAHVYEALTLLQIKSLQFTTQISQLIREQLVLTFETSDVYRVMVMDLKLAARGLNLVSASRVIFCEPVWQADVESQAIKRAHRIGQTKPVVVKTLVIRGTAEEKMLDRRKELQKIGGKTPKLLEEAGMRHYIEYPEFIESSQPSSATPQIDFPLFYHPDSDKPAPRSSPKLKRVRLEDPVPPKNRAVLFT